MEIEPCKTVDSTIKHGMFSMKNGNLGMSRLGITELVMSTLTEQTIHVPEVSFGRLPPLCSIFYWCIWGCAVWSVCHPNQARKSSKSNPTFLFRAPIWRAEITGWYSILQKHVFRWQDYSHDIERIYILHLQYIYISSRKLTQTSNITHSFGQIIELQSVTCHAQCTSQRLGGGDQIFHPRFSSTRGKWSYTGAEAILSF